MMNLEIALLSLIGGAAIAIAIKTFLAMRRQNKTLQLQKDALTQENKQLLQEKARLLEAVEQEKKRVEESHNMQEHLKLVFKNLSSEIIKEEKKDLTETQKVTFDTQVAPLKTEIQAFRQQIEKFKEQQIKGQTSLETQINLIVKTNLSLQKEASDLSMALRGNKKLQGNWGEIQLQDLFEATGVPYQKQVSIQTDAGRMIPDFVVNLSGERYVIVDSKVSLNHYMDYVNTEDEQAKEQFLNAYVEDIRKHIKELSNKSYQEKLHGATLDFVFMFLPLEYAYIEALKKRPSILQEAFELNIAIVTASTLLPILRTISMLWDMEKRHKNVEEIARLGGALHDKLATFATSLLDVGEKLKKAQGSYDNALKTLHTGRGNAIQTAKKLRELGAKTTKSFPKPLDTDDDLILPLEENTPANALDTKK